MILDTCALLWLVQGGGRLSPEARERINREPVVFVSAITGFEIGIKYRKGKLKLPAAPGDWFAAVVDHHGLKVLELDWRVCVRSTELPAVHSDPCDRMIIASALLYRFPVVTDDPVFEHYDVETLC
jgi:PIN domain nuclease of toxin-antitoxin system